MRQVFIGFSKTSLSSCSCWMYVKLDGNSAGFCLCHCLFVCCGEVDDSVLVKWFYLGTGAVWMMADTGDCICHVLVEMQENRFMSNIFDWLSLPSFVVGVQMDKQEEGECLNKMLFFTQWWFCSNCVCVLQWCGDPRDDSDRCPGA